MRWPLGAVAAFALAMSPAFGQSVAAGHAHDAAGDKPVPDLSAPDDSTGFMQPVTDALDAPYDQYLDAKSRLQNATGLEFSMPVSTMVQWATPKGGPAVVQLIYSPSISWTPFKDTAAGTGVFTFAFQGNQFWTGANTATQQARAGFLVAPSDWSTNAYQFSQFTYTHRFPGDLIEVGVGQYSFGNWDGNDYAGNPQSGFVNYALAQNGTQTYANAGIGGWVQVNPISLLHLAGGVQDATDIPGSTFTTAGLSNNKLAYFASLQLTPTFLAGGTYGVLYTNQPAVPLQPSAAQGISFSAVQNISADYGLFVRVNNSSGNATAITTSVAFGGIWNDPFGRNHLDQAGFGVVWAKTNMSALEEPARASEWVQEAYYNFTVFKAMQVSPDVQVYIRPALAPNAGAAAVFTVRTTFEF